MILFSYSGTMFLLQNLNGETNWETVCRREDNIKMDLKEII
jgi:hypothetical protein